MLNKLNTDDLKQKWTAAHPPAAEVRDATPEEHENDMLPEPGESFTDIEIDAIFPKRALHFSGWNHPEKKDDAYVRIRSVMQKLRVWPLRAYTIIRNRKAHTFKPAEDYPVFLIDEEKFKVIYQPLHPDPEHRYIHYGSKTGSYLHGLAQAKTEMKNREKAALADDQDYDQADEDEKKQKRKAEKIDEVLIVAEAGEAFGPALFGYFVCWQTHRADLLQEWDFSELSRVTKKVYQVRENTSAHKAQCHTNAYELLDLYTVELPEVIRKKRYDQEESFPVVTLKDYFQHQNDHQFTELLRDSLPYRFWEMQPEYVGRGNDRVRVGWKYDIDNVQVYNFLQKMGFHRMPVEGQKSEYIFVHKDHNIIRQRSANKVKNFIHCFLKERRLDKDLRNKLYTSNQLNESSLSNLDETEIDFTSFDHKSQYMFFENCTWEITAQDIITHKPGSVQRFVWEEDVIEHQASVIESPFRIKPQPDGKTFDIEVLHHDCLFFNYLIQTSRIHWRKELEDELDKLPKEEQVKYLAAHKFSIDGPLLTQEERHEQKQHLINKIFALGYMQHQHKERSKAWAVVAMDGKINQDGKSHGRSGKSICFNQALPKVLKNVFRISGTNPDKTKDPHIFHGLNKYHRLTVIDDADRGLNFRFFFEYITGDQVVNPKQNAPYTILFEDLCKLAWLTNFSFITDSSTEGRILYTVFSDYYHEKSENNDYREKRGPKDDFDKELFDQFDEKEYNAFYNTMARCLQFFLSTDVKINPPMNNVTKRNLQREMGQEFENWADVYFSKMAGNTDRIIVKSEAFQEYMADKAKGSAKETWFKNAIKAYCKFNGYVLNPEELVNDKKTNRIVHTVPVRTLDRAGNWITGDKQTKECLYIQTDFEKPLNTLKPGEEKLSF